MSRRIALVVSASLFGAALAVLSESGRAAEGPRTFVYVHAVGSQSLLYGFELGSDGSLTALPGSPTVSPDSPGDCTGACNALAWSPLRDVLLSVGSAGVTTWEITGGGGLVESSGSPFRFDVSEPGTGVATVTLGDRAFAYATQYFGGSMDGWEIAADGSLVRVSGLPLTGRPGSSVVDGGGSRVVFCDEEKHRIAAFTAAADGTLTEVPRSPRKVPGKGGIYWSRISPDGAHAFIGEWRRGRTIYSFSFTSKSGALRTGPRTKLKIREADGGMSIASNGLVAVFADAGENDVQIFSLKPTGKLKRLGKPQDTGLGHVTSHGFSPDGLHLVTASASDGLVRSFSVDPVTGTLTAVATENIATAESANGMVVIPR